MLTCSLPLRLNLRAACGSLPSGYPRRLGALPDQTFVFPLERLHDHALPETFARNQSFFMQSPKTISCWYEVRSYDEILSFPQSKNISLPELESASEEVCAETRCSEG
jgi:hypothetical protein